MIIEVDQSGKVEDTAVSTILALADNGRTRTVLLSGKLKREALNLLRQRGYRGNEGVLRVFVAGLYLLLEPDLPSLDRVILDDEYPGHDVKIRAMLLEQIRRAYPTFEAQVIVFAKIGKRSPAHKAAIGVTRGDREPDQVVTRRQLIRLL